MKRTKKSDHLTVKRRCSESDLFAAADIFDSIANSVSPICPKETHITKALYDKSKFAKYVASPTELRKASSHSSAISEIKELLHVLNQTNFILSQGKADALDTLDSITKFIKDNSNVEPDYIRKLLAKDIAIKNEIVSYATMEYNRLRKIIGVVNEFLDFVEKCDPMEYILVQDFLLKEADNIPSNVKLYNMTKKQISITFPSLEGAPERDVFHRPSTPQNGIICRMKQKFSQLEANDSTFIIESLAKGYDNYYEVEEIFFEEAWQMQPYPWSCALFCFSDVSGIIPKVFNPPYLSDRYSLISFGELALLSWWPLKSLVEKLKPVIYDINPFKICRTFWEIIDGIGDAVKTFAPKYKADEPLDFDQLFSYLIIIIFATLTPSITYALAYAASFREAVEDNDSHMRYAMGHLEGITSYFQNINYVELERKTKKIVKESLMKESSDPLGIAAF